MATKNYILDTNVLLHDPSALYYFKKNTLIIPIYALEELDNFKKESSELGRNSRQVARELDALREKGSLSDGVKLDNGGILRVVGTQKVLPESAGITNNVDNKLLATALDIKATYPKIETIFVTKDINLRIRADSLGLSCEDYEHDKLSSDEQYMGWRELFVEKSDIDELYSDGELELPDHEFYPNEFAILKVEGMPSTSALARYDGNLQVLVPLRKSLKDGCWGLKPRNSQQAFALDLLLDPNVHLVTLSGHAGTGKTIVAIAAGMQKVMEEQAQEKLLVARPIMPMGKDIGYLPGELSEKMDPWMRPIYDNVEVLMNLSSKDKKSGRSYREIVDMGFLQVEPLTFIRGRSIPNQFFIIDESQNLTLHEIKTIITRAGAGTKIVLTGDVDQIDNPFLDAESNGFSLVIEKFKGQNIYGHCTFTAGERSPLAELASEIL